MTLAAGQSLSFYEILGPLGVGAMGEVYRARDTRLGREVALKVLPAELARDEDRLRRFEREARALASLNHPNVAGIHGVDRVGEVAFLSLELVPGEDLAERLARGALPLEEALDVCRQIADGLEAAHEAGVVHRDLKPANVRVTPTGEIKLLDFGLAKPLRTEEGGSTTDSVLATEPGRVLGTPTYMAPEQARGAPIDRRVDVWAFGCVLYECLSGKRAFDGESLSDVLARVLEREPDWTALPARTPSRVRDLASRCLVKDPRQRLRDLGDARLELERVLEGDDEPVGEVARGAGRPIGWFLASLAVLIVSIAAILLRGALGDGAEPARRLRLSIVVPPLDVNVYPRLSPDGGTVVHEGELPAADGRPAARALFRRDLAASESVPLDGTEHPITFGFSPDGEFLAALVERPARGGELVVVKVAVRGTAPTVRLGSWPLQYRGRAGLAWLPDGRLISTADPDQLVLLSAGGGVPELRPIARALERSGAGIDIYRGLGDGRHVLGLSYYYEERGYVPAVVALDVETGREQVVLENAGHAALTADGRLLYSRGDTLFLAPFDRERLRPSGPGVAVAEGLRTPTTWQAGWFDLARDGTLVWLAGGKQGDRRQVAVLGASGELSPLWPERVAHDGPLNVAHDESAFVTDIVSASGERIEVWYCELEDPRPRRILAAPRTDFMFCHILPGGRELLYLRASDEGQNGIFRAPLDDPQDAELLLATDPTRPIEPVDVTPDGELVLVAQNDEKGVQFSTLPLAGAGPRTPTPLFRARREDHWPKFSQDGRWLVHVVDDVDHSRVVVQRFHADRSLGRPVNVPLPEGVLPYDVSWSREPGSGQLVVVVVDVDRRQVFTARLHEEEPPRFAELRRLAAIDAGYVVDAAPVGDGRLLLLLQDAEEVEVSHIEVVVGLLDPD